MINRRYPIQSLLAERKMFANGGMVSPQQPMQMQQPPMPMQMQQPMQPPPQMQQPMQPPPQMQQPMQPPPQMPMQLPAQMQQPTQSPAQGIMASSQPLVDAIAADALNPQGGGTLSEDDGTLSMAHGGAVGFSNGGGAFAPRVGDRTQIGLGAAPQDLRRRASMGSGELVNEMFPYEASLTGGFIGPQKSRPGPLGLGQEPGSSRPIVDAAKIPFDLLDQLARKLSQVNAGLGRTLLDFGQAALSVKPEETDYTNFYSQIEAVNNALRRAPEVKGVSMGDVAGTINDIAKTLLLEEPNITGEALSERLAQGVYNQYESGYARASADTDINIIDREVYEASTTEREDADDEEQFYNEELNTQINAYNIAIGEGPAAQQKFAQELSANPGYTQEFKDDVFGSVDVGPPRKAAVEPSVSETGGEIVADPDEDPYLDDLMGHTAADEAAYVAASRQPTEAPSAAGDQPTVVPPDAGDQPADNAVKQLRDTFKQGDVPPDETKKLLKDYMDEFKKAMPEYKGMSEEEKGWALLEASFRIMAGQSPDAITNIANGLKGLGPQFAKDAKEKRAWKRQVDLSAAKYALESVAKDRVQEIALAAEGRKRPYELVALKAFDFEGRPIKEGQAFPGTEQQLRDGLLEKYPLTYAKTYIANAKSVAALAKQALGGRVNPESFTKVQAKYLDDLANFKSGVRMKAVLRESARLATSGGVLGGTALLKDYANKAMNALGVQMKDRTKFLQAYSSTKREEYSAKQKRLGTLMATQLLRESSKTLSDYDRKRVEELIGALTGSGESLWASENVLKDRLINLEMSLDDGIKRSSNSMLSSEETWRKEITKGGTSLGNVLLRARQRGLGETTQLGGSPTARSYLLSDIYDRKTKKFKKGFRPGVNK